MLSSLPPDLQASFLLFKENLPHTDDAVLETNKKAYDDALDVARRLAAQIQNECLFLYEHVQALAEEIDKRALEKTALTGSNVDWGYLLHEDGSGTRAKRKALIFAIESLLALPSGIRSDGMSISGYSPKINQHRLQISLIKEKPLLTLAVLNALTLILPHVKMEEDSSSLPGEDPPYKIVSIIEKTLSHHGSYSLRINEGIEMYEVWICRYSHNSQVRKCKSLKELLEYVAEFLYYA